MGRKREARSRERRLQISLLLGTLLLLGLALGALSSGAESWSNQPIHWGFKKSTDHQPPVAGPEWEELLNRYDGFYLGDPSQKAIYLTFDNGYENGYTETVLDVLKEKEVPAAFFVTGHYVQDQPRLVKRMVEEGHIVGNHSWSHPDLTQVSDQRLRDELLNVEQAVEQVTGQKGMTYLRPPRGIFSERTLALAAELGYRHVFWSLAFVDWQVDRQRGWRYAYDNIMEQIHPGAVILLHTVSRDNAEALPKVIDDLRAEGYQFRCLDDLMIAKEGLPNL